MLNISNYRPNALIPAISEVLEKYVNYEILKRLEIHKLINDRQKSTADLLAYVTNIWKDTLQSYDEIQNVVLNGPRSSTSCDSLLWLLFLELELL